MSYVLLDRSAGSLCEYWVSDCCRLARHIGEDESIVLLRNRWQAQWKHSPIVWPVTHSFVAYRLRDYQFLGLGNLKALRSRLQLDELHRGTRGSSGMQLHREKVSAVPYCRGALGLAVRAVPSPMGPAACAIAKPFPCPFPFRPPISSPYLPSPLCSLPLEQLRLPRFCEKIMWLIAWFFLYA